MNANLLKRASPGAICSRHGCENWGDVPEHEASNGTPELGDILGGKYKRENGKGKNDLQ